jgi:hypothetical protein
LLVNRPAAKAQVEAQKAVTAGETAINKQHWRECVDATKIRRLKKKYVRVKKVGDKWSTYLQIDHQGFTVVEQTTKKRAEFFGKMLAIALSRVNAD